MMHLGLELYFGSLLYAGLIGLVLYSIFVRPIVGLYLLIPLLPLQTVRYRLTAYPLGGSFVGIVLLAVIIGLLRKRRKIFSWTPLNILLVAYGVFTFLSLCYGALYLHAPLPFLDPSNPRFEDWREYILMPLSLIVVAAAVEDRTQMRIILLLMCLGALALDKSYWSTISGRDFSEYSNDLRSAGAMGYAGVNGLAAFEAQFAVFTLGLAGWERNVYLRLGFYAMGVISALCLMFSLSRGGYVAFALACLFLAAAKQRKLIPIMVLVVVGWSTIAPKAVRERLTMTFEGGSLDHSSETRIDLWTDAMSVFDSNIVLGTGFNTYAYMGRIGNYRDTHNYFIKVLVETGILGFLLYLVLLGGLSYTGWKLHTRARDPLAREVGLGLASWMACVIVVNLFGDRWTFLQVNGYMWLIAGLAVRAGQMERERRRTKLRMKRARALQAVAA